MEYENIQFNLDDDGRIARIVLDRPEKLNSLTHVMAAELIDALGVVAAKAPRVLLLAANGRGFCAGADLGNFDSNFTQGDVRPKVDIGELLDRDYNPLMNALHSLDIPVVCAVNGVAAGAGASIAMLADIVVAAKSASFIQSFARIGLMSDCGATYLLPRHLGNARALGVALLGEPIPAELAAQWGLIWQCVEDDALTATTEQLVRQLAGAPTRALGATKAAIRASAHQNFADQLQFERDHQRDLGFERDFLEGIAAFREKRPPRFTASGN